MFGKSRGFLGPSLLRGLLSLLFLALFFVLLGVVSLQLSTLIPGVPLGAHIPLSPLDAVLLLIAWGSSISYHLAS